jgi:hypothetical protein
MGIQPLVLTQRRSHIDGLASVACPLLSPAPRLGPVPTACPAVQRVGGCEPAAHEIRAYARFRRESRPSS